MVQAAGDDRGSPGIDLALRDRSDIDGLILPAARCFRRPAHRLNDCRALWRLLKLSSHGCQIACRLLRVIVDDLEESLPERIVRLQTDEEVDVLEVGINLLKGAQDAIVSGVGA